MLKKVLSGITILALIAMPITSPSEFTAAADEGLSALEQLYEMHIVDGYEDGELHPERTLTRAQFAKFLVNAFEDAVYNQAAYMYTDVSESHWAYDAIQKASNSGWLQGFGDGTFRPEDNITYEQAVTVICRALGVANYNADYPASYLAAGIEYALTDGVNALVGEELSRENAAKLIVNMLNYEEGQLSRTSSSSKSYLGGVVRVESKSSSAGGGGGSAMGSVAVSPTMDYVTDDLEGFYASVYSNSEEYTANEENVFKDAVTSPLSTFSIDTDTASYSNLRRFILNGQSIPNGSVRTEELINYFDYVNAPTEEGKPFGVNYTVAQCPWNSDNTLAMITVSGEELKEPKPSNLVFLIDVSGSMYSYNKLPLVKQSLSVLLDKLGDEDRISIVTYASGTRVALEPTSASEKDKIISVIDGLTAGGSTAGASGINLAYEQAERYKTDGNNRIILCTDGDFNVGISSAGDLEELITQKRESGIYLSVLGFGMGNYKDSKMEILADKGNGNYAYIDNLREAKKVLADEMPKTIYTIAKDVKIQVEFNPEKVSSYRLVGYENRLLNNEDFDNDTKDAGELGAGATVTVLYEIVPQSGKTESILKYQTTETTGSNELMTVKIRYKEPESEESILSEYPITESDYDSISDDFKFAAAVAELGMILNDSEYKGSCTYDAVIELAREGLGDDTYGLRNEFVQLVDLLRLRR